MSQVSEGGIAFIQGWEACKLEAYLDSAGIPTIGFGTTRYPNGQRVRQDDTCTLEEADYWFRLDLRHAEDAVDDLTVDTVTDHQFDALVSFTYNCGRDAYKTSTLRKLVNADPDDPAIRWEFIKWHHANHKPVKGLWKRRAAEADLYFGTKTKVPTWPYS